MLLLDESLSGLTHDEAEELIVEIMALNRASGITVVVVEHVLSVLAKMVGRLVVLHNATVIADGTPMEVAHDPQVIQAYLGTRQSVFHARCGEQETNPETPPLLSSRRLPPTPQGEGEPPTAPRQTPITP